MFAAAAYCMLFFAAPVSTGLDLAFATSSRMSASNENGFCVGEYLLTGVPAASNRNLVKFHLTDVVPQMPGSAALAYSNSA